LRLFSSGYSNFRRLPRSLKSTTRRPDPRDDKDEFSLEARARIHAFAAYLSASDKKIRCSSISRNASRAVTRHPYERLQHYRASRMEKNFTKDTLASLASGGRDPRITLRPSNRTEPNRNNRFFSLGAGLGTRANLGKSMLLLRQRSVHVSTSLSATPVRVFYLCRFP